MNKKAGEIMRLFKKKKQAAGINENISPFDEKLIALLDYHRIDTVFDIGANIGQYAQRIRAAGFRGRIVSFEPLAANHETLTGLAASDPQWEIAPRMAVGAQDGITQINVSQNHDMSSILPIEEATLTALPKSKVVDTQTVDLRRIDSIFDNHVKPGARVFVKVDTQGFEQAVIDGAQTMMAMGKILGWQLELSLFPLYSGEATFETITHNLKETGYEAHLIIPGYFSKKLMRQLQIDGVFFKSDT
jgi:FkbM family methyltransferase